MTTPLSDPGGDPPQLPQDLEKSISHLLEEGRMILPGVQALFGFQLIAVFSTAFGTLTPADRALHLASIGLVSLCVALVLAPVAFHRLVEPRGLSEALIAYSSWMLLAAQALLMVALWLDFTVVARLAVHHDRLCWWLSAGLFAVFLAMWFLVPLVVRWRRLRAHRRATRGMTQL